VPLLGSLEVVLALALFAANAVHMPLAPGAGLTRREHRERNMR
jgi:hypothetical protein